MLAKEKQEVSIPIATITLSFVPIKVNEDLNMPLANTETTLPKVVVSTTKVSPVIIVSN